MKDFSYWSLACGLLLIVGGLLVLFNPTLTAYALLAVIGAGAVIVGIARLTYIIRIGQHHNPVQVLLPVLVVLLGLPLLFSRYFKVAILGVISFLIGLLLIIRGVIGSAVAFQNKNYSPRWMVSFIINAIYTLLGIVFLFNPLSSGTFVSVVLAVVMILIGVDLILRRYLNRR